MNSIRLQDLLLDPAAFLARIEAGESLIVSRDGRPVAEVRPIRAAPREPRPFGLAAGEFTVPADFDDPLPEDVLQAFEGR